jgi:hypothetical protein
MSQNRPFNTQEWVQCGNIFSCRSRGKKNHKPPQCEENDDGDDTEENRNTASN